MRSFLLMLIFISLVFGADNPSSFAVDYISALSYINRVENTVQEISCDTNTIYEKYLCAFRVLQRKSVHIQNARQFFVPHRLSKDELRSTIANEAFVACSTMLELFDSQERLLQRVIDGEILNTGVLLQSFSLLQTQQDLCWENLTLLTALLTHSLVSNRTNSAGQRSYLCITKEERIFMLSVLPENTEPVSENSQQTYAQVCVSLLQEFLTKGFKCSDEQ